MAHGEWRIQNGELKENPLPSFIILDSPFDILNLHDLQLFLVEGGVDLTDIVVVELLDLVEAAALVVLADGLVLLHLLELVVALAARLAYAVARVLGHVVGLLDALLAPLLG